MNKYHIVGCECIFVQLYGIDAILFGVRHFYCFGRQFSFFAHRHKSHTKFITQNWCHNKAARLDAYNFRNTFIFVKVVHSIFEKFHTLGIFERCCQILKHNSLCRKIGHCANVLFNFFYCHNCVFINCSMWNIVNNKFLHKLFHVEHYRPSNTKRTLISFGETPGMRLA